MLPMWRWHSPRWTPRSIVRSPNGERSIPFADFHRLPGEHAGARQCPRSRRSDRRDRSARPASRDAPRITSRSAIAQSYEFALVSAAAAVAMDGRRISSARLAMGGVAHKPWRLTGGRERRCGESRWTTLTRSRSAISLSFADARPLAHNAFKIELAQRVALRALQIGGSTRMNAIGQPISRVDGRLKVTGGARYTADIPVAGAVHAAIVHSTIANGRTLSIDTAAAEKAPGCHCDIHPSQHAAHESNAQALEPPSPAWTELSAAPRRPDSLRRPADRPGRRGYARTASHAGTLIEVQYEAGKPTVFGRHDRRTRRPILRNSSGRSTRRSAMPGRRSPPRP